MSAPLAAPPPDSHYPRHLLLRGALAAVQAGQTVLWVLPGPAERAQEVEWAVRTELQAMGATAFEAGRLAVIL